MINPNARAYRLDKRRGYQVLVSSCLLMAAARRRKSFQVASRRFTESSVIKPLAAYAPSHLGSINEEVGPLLVRVATLIAAAVGAAAIGVASPAHADVGFMTGLGGGGSTTSSGPYDDCPPGTYRAKSGDCVERPDSNRGGATGQCCDGTDTHAEHRTGACSHHGGVCQWFAAAGTRATSPPAIRSAFATDIGNRPSVARSRL
jgi:hypothetical protein